jgi:hypothetical protein
MKRMERAGDGASPAPTHPVKIAPEPPPQPPIASSTPAQ